MQTFPTLQFRSSAISSDHCLNEVQFRMSLDGVFMCIAAALGPPSKSFEVGFIQRRLIGALYFTSRKFA